MDANTIKFKTIQFVNGTKYISNSHLDYLKHIMCHNLEIEKTEDNFKAVEDGVKTYFETVSKIQIS